MLSGHRYANHFSGSPASVRPEKRIIRHDYIDPADSRLYIKTQNETKGDLHLEKKKIIKKGITALLSVLLFAGLLPDMAGKQIAVNAREGGVNTAIKLLQGLEVL